MKQIVASKEINMHITLDKNRSILLTNLHLLGRYRLSSHPSDGITTDALIVLVKCYLLHERNENLYIRFFFLKLML